MTRPICWLVEVTGFFPQLLLNRVAQQLGLQTNALTNRRGNSLKIAVVFSLQAQIGVPVFPFVIKNA